MSITYSKRIKCSVCGESDSYSILKRKKKYDDTSWIWRGFILECSIQRCPSCGYCSSNISKQNLVNTQFIRSRDYLNQLDNNSYPALANSYLCWSMIQENNNNFVGAIRSLIDATTVCEDYIFYTESEDHCREKIVGLIEAIEQKLEYQKFKLSYKEYLFLLKIFNLRRIGNFEKAQKLYEQNLERINKSGYKYIFEFLYENVLQRNRGSHIRTCCIENDFLDESFI